MNALCGFPVPAALALAALLGAGCHHSGSGGGGAKPTGSPPAVVAIQLPPAPVGEVDVRFTVLDAESDPVDVTVEVSRDLGVTWRPGSVIPGSPVAGLPSSPGGIESTLIWDSVADLGFRDPQLALLRITPSDAGAGAGTADVAVVPPIDNLSEALKRVEFPMVHYGPFDAAALALAEAHDLVVVHPRGADLTRALVQEIGDGVDPNYPGDDVIVLGYISVGEDLRTVNIDDASMLLDPRFVGDGTGPRIDPRGPNADGGSLAGLDPLGLPSNGGTGYASWYLDDNSVDNDPGDVGDGLPDRNGVFGGCFTNAGDPQWFDVLRAMTLDGADGLAGFDEILTLATGRGLRCDGVFLDTIDTCAPNSFTDGTSANQSEFEWTAPGFTDFMAQVKQTWPDRLVLQNRGLFFFDSRHPHYRHTPRPHVDLVMMESYRLNSSNLEEYNDYFFPDNKYNIAPKLMAESGRSDGFTVLSLGYAEGPAGVMDAQTLVGGSTIGLASLLEDIREAQDLAGFRHYLADALVVLPNRFVLDNATLVDVDPPAWTSTYNANIFPFPTPPGAPDPRVGIQEVQAGPGVVHVSWDVALDRNRVGYALYFSDTPFDFVLDPTLAAATRLVLDPEVGAGYAVGPAPGVYPNESTITGLVAGTTYYFCIRAFDAAGNEEANEVVLSATPHGPLAVDGDFSDWGTVAVAHVDPADVPDSAGPDWLEVKVASDGADLFIRFTSENAFNLDGSPAYGFSRTLVFIDADGDPSTGWGVGAIGSELLVAGDSLYSQDAGVFNAGFLETISITPTTAATEVELAVPVARILQAAPDARRIRILLVNDDVLDFAPDAGYIAHLLTLP